MKKARRPLSRLLLIPLISLMALFISAGAALSETIAGSWQDITANVTVIKTNPLYDLARNVYTSQVSVKNAPSTAPITGKLRVVITASSKTPLNPDGISEDGKPFYYLQTDQLATLGVNQSTTPMAISFPASRGAITFSLRIENWQEVHLLADLTIAKSHNGNFSPGQTGAKYNLSVTNSGPGATGGAVTATDNLPAGLTATAIAGSGWSCNLASLSCTRSDALAAGASYPPITLTVNVAANAPATVINSANVAGGGDSNNANNNASDPTTIIAVLQQPSIQVSPTPLLFGDVTVNTSTNLPLTIGNSGAADLVVGSITASGLPFSVFPPTSFTVAPGATRQVNIGFAPTVTGLAPGTVSINSNAAGQATLGVNLSGTGVAVQGVAVINAPTAVDFGSVMEGVSVAKDVTVKNIGTAPLTLSGANLSSGVFACTPSLPLTILPGASANITAVFTPGSGSGGTTLAATLVLVSDGGNANVALSGNSVAQITQPPSQTVLSARVKSGAIYDSITLASCGNVSGEVQFGSGSLLSDTFIVTLTDQGGSAVSSASFSATQGSGVATFSGIAACGLKDGTIGVTVIVNSLSPATGTPAAKNTSSTFGPITLDPVAPATVFSTIQVCGSAPAGSLVQIAGGASSASIQLAAVQSTFCLDVSLRKNTENLLIANATDTASGQVATAAPVKVTQVDPSSVLIAQASSRPLTTAEVETLVQNGVINLNDPSNFNVSMFTIVLTIGQFPVTISQPVVLNPTPGTISYGSGGATGGWGGGGGGASSGSSSQIVVIQTPTGQTIPGVIIIDGRIKTLKEFFQVTIAIQNVTTQFNLTDMVAKISIPAGLSPVKAGLGTDVANINSGSAIDTVNMGTIGPSETGTGQFIIRGDGIGTHNVTVNFDGFLSGGGLQTPTPISGSAGTSVQVFGPPKLDVVVRHPGNPGSSADDVTAGQIYTLTVEITNRSQVPALYTSLQLLIGQGAKLVDQNGVDIPGSSTEVALGHIQPGQTVSQAFRVKSLLTGKIIACQAVTSENINLTVDTGGGSCNIANTIPVNFQFPPANAPPTVMAINPLNNQPNLPVTTSIMAILTPQTACLTPDTWSNVVTGWIDPSDHSKGIQVISANLASIGTFYLEEIDSSNNPVRHIPTDLTLTTGVDGNTTIAVLRLGLASPLSQYFLKPNTAYRATLVSGANGVCNKNLPSVTLANTFQWTFSTEQTCSGITAPIASMSQPLDGSIDRPLNQKIVLDFSNRMSPATFTYDAATPLNSSFLVLSGGSVSGGDVVGGTVVPGSAAFSALLKTFTYTPASNLPQGSTIHVRLKNALKDICGNPLQTPAGGIKLLSFTTIPPDTTPPALPIVNPVPALTGQASIQVSGSAEAMSTITVTGGVSTVTTTASAAGLFSVNVSLSSNATTSLQVKAKDASNNESTAVSIDKNGAPLSVVNDSIAPMVASLSIPNGATNVPRNASITVTMSENINPGTVNSLNFKLEGSVIPGTFNVINPTTFTFTPTALLDYNKTYTVRMRAGGISDLAGNSLANVYVSTFSTESFPVPTLTLLNPASGTQGTTFNVTFTGTNLATASAVVSSNPGISGGITSMSDTSVVASITVTPSAVTGATTLGLTTLGGTVTLPFTIYASPSAALIARWSFNEGSGTTAFDSVGSVNGTLVGGAAFTPSGGISGGALQITDGYVTMGNHFASTSTFSVQAWVKTAPGDTSPMTPVSKHRAGIGQGYYLSVNNVNDGYTQNSLAGFRSIGATSPTAVGGPPVNDGLWHQLVGVYNNGNTSIYVDGIFAGSGSGGYSNNSADFMVGGLFNVSWIPANLFHGLIDEVEIYNSALTGNEVKALYDTYVSGVTLAQLNPSRGSQGATFNVTFSGTKLATASAVVSANPGISGTITTSSDTSVTASITITPLAATGATTLGLSTLGGTVSLAFTVDPAANNQVPSHSGLANPVNEGFSLCNNVGTSTVGPIANDLGQAVWFVAGAARTSQFCYTSGDLSSVQKAAIATNGFALTLNARVLQGLAPAYDTSNRVVTTGAVYETGSRRFEIELGLDGNGDTVVVLPTSIDASGPGGTIRAPGPSYTLAGSGSSYHAYQLVYDPASQLADLYVDGVKRIQGYAGHTSYVYYLGLVFGDWSGGQGNFALVQLATGTRNYPSPTLSQLSSSSGVQGTTFNVTFTGTNLDMINSVVSANPGVSGTIISTSETSVVASITIAQQATIGATTLGLNTLGGTVSLPFTVNGTGTISLANFEVGKDLQVNTVAIFTPAPAAGTVATITSSDATKLLLSTNPTAAGAGNFNYTMPGGAAIGNLYAQALAGSGSATVTISTPGYAPVTATATLRPSGFITTNSNFNTVVGDTDTTVTIAARMLNDVLNPIAASQVRGGFTANVPVVSSNPAFGTILTSPVAITGGSSSATTAFHPVAGGSTIISLTTPSGFSTPTSSQSITATVVGKVITLNTPTTTLVTRASYNYSVSLAAPAGPGGQLVNLSAPGGIVTIPATVTVPEGSTSAGFTAATALTTGPVTLTATAPGFTGDSRNLTVANRSFTITSPLVGIDRTVTATLTLDQPAPTGGATFNLSVANTTIATVTPATLTIPAGSSSVTFQLKGGLIIGFTTVTADGTTNGYVSKTLNITVTDRLLDLPAAADAALGTTLTVPLLIAPDAAPVGGVEITVTSSNPSIVQVLTPTVTVPAGTFQASVQVQAAAGATGSATITASNPGFAPDVMQVTVTSSLDIIENFAAFGSGETDTLNVQLISGNKPFPAPAGGVQVSFSSSNTACVAVTSPVTIAAGTTLGASTLTYGGSAALPCTATVTATNALFGTDTVQVTVGQTPDLGDMTISDISGSSGRVGASLQAAYRVNLTTSSHGGVTVQIKSSNPTVARLAANATSPGKPVVELIVPNGQNYIDFYVQGVRAATGSATLTARNVRFTTANATITVVQPVFYSISNLTTPTTTLSADDEFYVYTGIFNAAGTAFQQYQVVSGEGPLPVTFTSSNPAVGQMAKTGESAASVTIDIPMNQYYSPTSKATGGIAFDPLTGGTTTVAVTAPGFNSAWPGSSLAVTVSQPGITLADNHYGDRRIGAGLEVPYTITLGGASHGGVTVRITSSAPSVAKVSLTSTTAGTDFIDIPFANGESSKTFYLQGVSIGTSTLTATQALFSAGTVNVTVVPPVLNIYSLPTSTTSLSANSQFFVRAGYLHTNGVNFQYAFASGAADLSVTLTSSNPAVGTLVTTPLTGGSVTITIVKGNYDSPSSVAAGGAAFHPLTGGTTTVAATAPGTNNAYSSSAVTITVSQPGITLADNHYGDRRIGAGLEVPYTITLGGASHGGVTVRITSSAPSVAKVSLTSTTAGTDFIDIPFANGESSKTFYLQGVSTGAATLTATQALFSAGTVNVTVVPPVLHIYSLPTSTTSLSANSQFFVRAGYLHTNGVNFQYAFASGAADMAVTLTSSNPAVGTLVTIPLTGGSVTITIAKGNYDSPSSVASGGAAFHPLTGGSTTVAATAPGTNNAYSGSAVAITVSQPGITLADNHHGDRRIGAGLEVPYTITLGGASHGGVTVRITSSAPSVAKVSLTSTTAGTDFIDVPFADGVSSKTFYLQGVSTGAATLTATQALFSAGTINVTVVPPVLHIYSLPTSTTSLSANTQFMARSGYLHSDGTSFQYAWVSGAADLMLTLTSSNPAVGTLVTTPLTGASVTITIAKGNYDSPSTVASGGPAFHPLTGGTTTVAATAPGTNNAYSGSAVTITVSQPGITITDSWHGDYRIGGGLEAPYTITLGGAAHGGVMIRVASSDTTRILLAPDGTTAGTSFIDLFIPDGQTSKGFYIQGINGVTGTVALSATNAAFVTGTRNVELVQGAIYIYNLGTSLGVAAADNPFYVRTGYIHSNGSTFQYARVSPAGPLHVLLTSSTPSVGQLKTAAATGAQVTVDVAVNAFDSPSTVATGGVSFDPLTTGGTIVSTSVNGFNNSWSGSTMAVTVTP